MAGSILGSARRGLGLLAAILTGVSLVLPSTAQAAFLRPRYAAILIDARTGEVLYANAADEARHPASITKVMTLFLAFDALVAGRLRLSDPIVMSRHAASQRPSKLGLAPGRSISLDDAIHIITVKSANDVAVALGERIGGSEEGFARMMTRKARALGMSNTTFTNATGLPDEGNVTTARDIATLSAALLKQHPSYYSYFGQQAFKYDSHSYTNHNRLLGKLTGLDGIKTGFTNDSGYTLAASAIRNGQRLITVVLGEPSIPARNRDVTALLDAGFTVLERRRQGEDTSVAFNMPTLNHPALRLANPTEMGLRLDPATFRRQLAAPPASAPLPSAYVQEAAEAPTPIRMAAASSPREVRAPAKRSETREVRERREAREVRAETRTTRGHADARASRTAHAVKGSRSEEMKAARAEPSAKGSKLAAARPSAKALKSDEGSKLARASKSAEAGKSEKASKSERASKSDKGGETVRSAAAHKPAATKSASSRSAGRAKTVATADADAPTRRSAVDDWNAKFKSPRRANP